MSEQSRSMTTRRWFIGGLSGSVFALAGLWKALGLITGDDGHSHGGGGSLTRERFRSYLELYLQRYRRDDGVVQPPTSPEDHHHSSGTSDHRHPIPVYLQAVRWQFVPRRYRLTTGIPYEFRMMAMDVTHGASIQAGTGSVMHRLPPGKLVQDTLRFEQPGTYPVYCSYYCGEGHPEMSATLVVE